MVVDSQGVCVLATSSALRFFSSGNLVSPEL